MDGTEHPYRATVSTGPGEFPSIAHRNRLRQQSIEGRYETLRDDELWHHHAYDYGWRRVVLSDRQDRSPIDEHGRWFNSELADAAAEMFRREFDRRRAASETARDRQAQAARDAWARSHGCDSFEQAVAIGLQRVGRQHS